MSQQADWPTTTGLADPRRWWLRLLVGVVAIGVGVAAFAWPEVTVRVVGVLFGLNLLVTGTVRAVGLSLLREYPMRHRVLGIAFGVLTAVVGLFCLSNVTGSIVLLAFVVGLGWLLDGLSDLIVGFAGHHDPDRGWRIAAGLAYVLAAIAVLLWPKPSVATFLAIGALFLIVAGVAQVAGAIASRTPHRGSAPDQEGAAHG